MAWTIYILAFTSWSLINNCVSQTTDPSEHPSCLEVPRADALHCFTAITSTLNFSDAMATCEQTGDELPLLATKEMRKNVVDHSLPRSKVPFWVDLRSLTRANITSSTVHFDICGVGKDDSRPNPKVLSFDYCYKKRRAVCCQNRNLMCVPTEESLTWFEAELKCSGLNKTMFGSGQTVTEIEAKFDYVSECDNCWVGLRTTVHSQGFVDQVVSEPAYALVLKPGPCAVVNHEGDGITKRCSGGGELHNVVCERYVTKHHDVFQDTTTPRCPPEGCVKHFRRGGDIKLATAVIMTVGLPLCITIFILAGIMHRKKNPIYNRIQEPRHNRRASQVSYIPGGANTQF